MARGVMREIFPRSNLHEANGDQFYAVFDELLFPDGERTLAGLALFDALARPEEFPLLEKVEINGSGGRLVALFAATAAPQNVVARAIRPTEIDPKRPLTNDCFRQPILPSSGMRRRYR